MTRLILTAWLLVALAAPLVAEDWGMVEKVTNGHTLVLDDGRKVVLRGVEEAGPNARNWLEVYCLDRKVQLKNVTHAGFGTVRAVPLILGKVDVCGLMLYTGHGKLMSDPQVPGVMLVKWRTYQKRAQTLRLGYWAGSAPASAAVAAPRVPAPGAVPLKLSIIEPSVRGTALWLRSPS